MPWLLQNCVRFSDGVKVAIQQVASRMLERIASSYFDDVDAIFLIYYPDPKITGFKVKVQLFRRQPVR